MYNTFTNKKNNGIINEEKSSKPYKPDVLNPNILNQKKLSPISLNNSSGYPKATASKPYQPKVQSPLVVQEKLEQDRIAKANKKTTYKFVEDEDARKTAKLTTKTPEDYYRKPPNDNEEYKRFKELYGAKTDFSISNYENNYDMMNEDEKIIFTSKAQTFLNLQGYRDKGGLKWKNLFQYF